MRGRAFVVDIERTASTRQRTVIDDGDAFRGDALAHAAGESRGALAIEITFETVTNGFVQKYPGPARAEHDLHCAGRRVHGIEVHQRLPQRLARPAFGFAAIEQFDVTVASAAAGKSLLAATIRFHDHLHIEANEWANICGNDAVRACKQNRFDATRKAHRDLLHARIGRPKQQVDRAQSCDFRVSIHRVDRVQRRIQRAAADVDRRATGCLDPAACNRPRRAGCFEQRVAADVVGIRKTGFLAADRAHAEPLVDRVRAVLDDAVFNRPTLAACMLEIQIAIVHAWAQQTIERPVEHGNSKAAGSEQTGFGVRDHVCHGSVLGHGSLSIVGCKTCAPGCGMHATRLL